MVLVLRVCVCMCVIWNVGNFRSFFYSSSSNLPLIILRCALNAFANICINGRNYQRKYWMFSSCLRMVAKKWIFLLKKKLEFFTCIFPTFTIIFLSIFFFCCVAVVKTFRIYIRILVWVWDVSTHTSTPPQRSHSIAFNAIVIFYFSIFSSLHYYFVLLRLWKVLIFMLLSPPSWWI